MSHPTAQGRELRVALKARLGKSPDQPFPSVPSGKAGLQGAVRTTSQECLGPVVAWASMAPVW